MTERRRFRGAPNRVLAVFTTALVVLGVVGVALLTSMMQKAEPKRSSQLDEQPTVAPVLLLLNESSATLLDLSGSSTRITMEDFARGFAENLPSDGADAANGSAVSYADQIRSKDGRIVRLGMPKTDGASVMDIEENGRISSIVLRIGAAPLRDARVHGWSETGTVFVTAIVTSTRAVFSVDAGGAIRELAALPDTVFALETRNGAVWFIAASPGEGIESDPMPPSEAYRVNVSQVGERILREESRLILSLVPGPRQAIAYLTNDGLATFMKIGDPTSAVSLGKKRPLLFLQDGRLLVRDGFDLFFFDQVQGVSSKIGTLPEGRVTVYELPKNR